MPNIAALLKQEITRLARREVRAQVQATKKASTQYRRHIAALRARLRVSRQTRESRDIVHPLVRSLAI